MENLEPSNSSESKPEKPAFQKAEDYLREKSSILAGGYSLDGKTFAHCGIMAAEIAKLIIGEGGRPQLLSIRGRKTDTANTEPLTPRCYKGIEWGGHTVCENDGLIYDPMMGRPIPRDEYLQTVFLHPAEARISVPFEKIAKFIEQ